MGGATVTPEVDAGVATSTNVYRRQSVKIPAAGVLVAPRIGVESYGSTSQFRLQSSLSRTQWVLDFGDAPANDVWRASRTDGLLDIDWVVMPTDSVGFALGQTVLRQNKVQPAVLPGADGRGLVTRTDSLSDLALRIAPGSALAIDVGGFADIGTVSVGVAPDYRPPTRSYRLGGGPQLGVKWNFFPRTALLIDGQYEWFSWIGAHTNAGQQWRVNTAVNGRVTGKLVINANLGYGRATFASGNTVGPLDGLLAGAKFQFEPIRGLQVAAGYQKGWEDSFFTEYLAWHYGYGTLDKVISNSASVHLEGGVRLENYEGATTTVDTLVRADGSLVYSPSAWADVSVGAGYWKRASAGTDIPAHVTATVRW